MGSFWRSACKGAAVALGLIAGPLAVTIYAAKPGPDHVAHVVAMYRIDPQRTDNAVRLAADHCLQELLPEEWHGVARISPLLIDAYANGLAHYASFRDDHVLAAHEREARETLARDQNAYNASFAEMTDTELAVATALRQRIASEGDPYWCIHERVASARWLVYLSGESGGSLRGTVDREGQAAALARLVEVQVDR